jgi:hypothetical protein
VLALRLPPVEASQSAEDRPEQQQPSEVDAMGKDKRRQVVGQSYGPSRASQLFYYGLFLAFVVVVYFGAKVAISELDKAPAKDKDQAPWTKNQIPPQRFQ